MSAFPSQNKNVLHTLHIVKPCPQSFRSALASAHRCPQGFHNVELHDGYLHSARYGSVPYRQSQFVADDYFHWLKKEKGADADRTDASPVYNRHCGQIVELQDILPTLLELAGAPLPEGLDGNR